MTDQFVERCFNSATSNQTNGVGETLFPFSIGRYFKITSMGKHAFLSTINEYNLE